MRLGFIGLGNMGRAAARNLQRAGFGLAVYDIRAEAGDDLVRDGATRASSPAELIGEVDVAGAPSGPLANTVVLSTKVHKHHVQARFNSDNHADNLAERRAMMQA